MLVLAALILGSTARAAAPMGDAEAERLGQRIFLNETGGRRDRLVWWNAGEEFPSLGIGHFIWYPSGVDGPFTESFPDLLRFLEDRGVTLPAWLRGAPPCPWPRREALEAARGGTRVQALEELLASTFADQSRFLVQRLERALPRLTRALPPEQGAAVQARARSLLASPEGRYALVDYVNFKGEGLNPRERYGGRGWGLLQVLQEMPPARPATAPGAFAEAAARVLKRRVRHAPAERDEARWLPGWMRRVASYGGEGATP